MLRITESFENEKTVRLRVDGNLTETSYPELESIFVRHHARDGTVLFLDMAGVVFVQDTIAEKLVNLRGERLRIINCSPFVETLLETIAR